MFSHGGDLGPQKAVGNVGRRFWLLQHGGAGRGTAPLASSGRGEGILLNILQMLQSPFPPSKMLCPQVSVVSRLRSPVQRENHIKEQKGRGELEKRCTRI